jgi:hypothetical protein
MSYTPDNEAMDRKRSELVGEVAKMLDPRDAKVAERVVDHFCRMSPPMDPPRLMHMITLDQGGRGGGHSRKPGNLALNWKRLRGDFGDLVLTAAGVVAAPWLIPFAALSIWNKFWTHATIDLTKEQGASLCAMWHRCDNDHRISRSAALAETNQLFQVFKWPPLSDDSFSDILRDLERLQCIEVTDEEIWLREWVQTTYD